MNLTSLRCKLLLIVCSLAPLACAPKKVSEAEIREVFPSEQNLKCAGEALQNRFLVEWKDGEVTLESARSREDFIEERLIPEFEHIKRVESDHVVQLIQPTLSRMERRAIAPNWGVGMIKAPALWARGIKGQGVEVAVIDSGADIHHQQLEPQITVNLGEINGQPGVDDDQNGYVDDIHGWDFVEQKPLVKDHQYHGTHVAGTILANPEFGEVQGVAPQARLLPLAFISESGEGSIANAVLAIQYAMSRGVRIINASWGGSGCSTILRDTIANLESKGVLFIAAAGNDGSNIDVIPSYPASFSRMGMLPLLSVGASTDLDWQAGFSNEGYQSVHLLAPGLGILSTVPDQKTKSLDGTSMAAPFVSGAAALLWSAQPQATLAQIRESLLAGVDTGEYVVTTKGRLNVEKALSHLEKLMLPTPQLTP